MATISLDLRQRIVDSYDNGEGTRPEIAHRYRVSLGMVKKSLQQRRHTGDIAPRHRFSGSKPKIQPEHRRQLRALVAQKPDMTLEELRRSAALDCTLPAIHYVLVKMGLTFKKRRSGPVSKTGPISPGRAASGGGASKASNPARLVFIDESSAKTNMTRLRGRAPRGKRLHAASPYGHWHTTTMIGSIRIEGSSACMAIEGATDTEVFHEYVRQVLGPSLRPGDIVVLDNLTPHKSPATIALIEQAGAQVQFLPAYSPDLNPIEKMWSKIKQRLRSAEARNLPDLHQAIADALQSITLQDARSWFASCGYSFI